MSEINKQYLSIGFETDTFIEMVRLLNIFVILLKHKNRLSMFYQSMDSLFQIYSNCTSAILHAQR